MSSGAFLIERLVGMMMSIMPLLRCYYGTFSHPFQLLSGREPFEETG